jgi:hypothetical protein
MTPGSGSCWRTPSTLRKLNGETWQRFIIFDFRIKPFRSILRGFVLNKIMQVMIVFYYLTPHIVVLTKREKL